MTLNKVTIPTVNTEPLNEVDMMLSIGGNTGYEDFTTGQVDHGDEFEHYVIDRDFQSRVFESLRSALSTKLRRDAYLLVKPIFEDQTDVKFSVEDFKKESCLIRNKCKERVKQSISSAYAESTRKDGSVAFTYLLKYSFYHYSVEAWAKLFKYYYDENSRMINFGLSNIAWLAADDENIDKKMLDCINSILLLLTYRVATVALNNCGDNVNLSNIYKIITGDEVKIESSDPRLHFVHEKYKDRFEEFIDIISRRPYICITKAGRFIEKNRSGNKATICSWWKGLEQHGIVMKAHNRQSIVENMIESYKMQSLSTKTYGESAYDDNMIDRIIKVKDRIDSTK